MWHSATRYTYNDIWEGPATYFSRIHPISHFENLRWFATRLHGVIPRNLVLFLFSAFRISIAEMLISWYKLSTNFLPIFFIKKM